MNRQPLPAERWLFNVTTPPWFISPLRIPRATLAIRQWIALALLVFAGCQPAANPPSTAVPPSDKALVKVRLALNWFPEMEHGGFYAAQVHGDYAAEGLDVEIVPGGPKAPVIAQVADGAMEFGVHNADVLLLGRAQQADVVALLAPIGESPRCIMVHAASGIATWDDLPRQKGFTLAMNTGQPYAKYLQHRLGLEALQVVSYPGNVAAFLSNQQYGQQAYSFSEPYLARREGATPQLLMLSDLGFNTYTSVLVCSRKMIDQKPDLVRRMVRATAKGWQRYLEQPAETHRQLLELNRELTAEALDFGFEQVAQLAKAEGRFGEMTLERWQKLADQMTASGSLEAGSVAASDAFTNEMLTPIP